jgi:hypothetical protein
LANKQKPTVCKMQETNQKQKDSKELKNKRMEKDISDKHK